MIFPSLSADNDRYDKRIEYICQEIMECNAMKSFVFEISYGGGPKFSNATHFTLELDDAEIAYIKDYLKRNGNYCGYGYIETDDESIYKDFPNGALFEKINDAVNDAILASINKGRKKKLEFEDIPWESLYCDFSWDKELMAEEWPEYPAKQKVIPDTFPSTFPRQ